MKKLIILIALILVTAGAAAAQLTDTVSVKAGKTKTAAHGNVKIRFISVVEDSRCPENAKCIWAGNARIKLELTGENGHKEIVMMNTASGQRGAKVDSWSVNLDSLTPGRRTSSHIPASSYTATFTVVRIQR